MNEHSSKTIIHLNQCVFTKHILKDKLFAGNCFILHGNLKLSQQADLWENRLLFIPFPKKQVPCNTLKENEEHDTFNSERYRIKIQTKIGYFKIDWSPIFIEVNMSGHIKMSNSP